MSAVKRLQQTSHTYIFRYAAIRLLQVDIFLDRRTAECIGRFIEPLIAANEEESNTDHPDWVSKLTSSLAYSSADSNAAKEIEKLIHTANSGRIYVEQLHLHPVRLGLTFTQEWMEWNPGTESMMVFQFIRGMVSRVSALDRLQMVLLGLTIDASPSFNRLLSRMLRWCLRRLLLDTYLKPRKLWGESSPLTTPLS